MGIGTDMIRQAGFDFKTVRSPYADGEEFVAMPAITPDVALIHAHRSDQRGDLLTLSPDPFFDELLVRASGKAYATVEKIVPTADLNMRENNRFNLVERAMITGVAEVPHGAHPTSAAPDYHLDLKHIKTYVESAATPEAWADYKARFIDVPQDDYVAAVGGSAAIEAAPAAIY